MKRLYRMCFWFCLLGGSMLCTNAAAQWHSVADSSLLEFFPQFEGQDIPGRFGGFSVTMAATPGDPGPQELLVRIQVDTASLEDTDINEEVAGPDWFDFAAHSEAVFRSTDIRPVSDDAYAALGELQLKGVVRTVTVPFRWSENEAGASLRGSLVLDRNRFGIGAGDWSQDDSIGFAVRVRFDVKLERTNAE